MARRAEGRYDRAAIRLFGLFDVPVRAEAQGLQRVACRGPRCASPRCKEKPYTHPSGTGGLPQVAQEPPRQRRRGHHPLPRPGHDPVPPLPRLRRRLDRPQRRAGGGHAALSIEHGELSRPARRAFSPRPAGPGTDPAWGWRGEAGPAGRTRSRRPESLPARRP